MRRRAVWLAALIGIAVTVSIETSAQEPAGESTDTGIETPAAEPEISGEDPEPIAPAVPSEEAPREEDRFSAPPERVELEFDAALAPHVRGRVWHESQQVQELPDGRIRMSLDVSNDWALRSWLLGFGSRVRVLAPDSLAASLAEEFRRGAELYRTEDKGQRAE